MGAGDAGAAALRAACARRRRPTPVSAPGGTSGRLRVRPRRNGYWEKIVSTTEATSRRWESAESSPEWSTSYAHRSGGTVHHADRGPSCRRRGQKGRFCDSPSLSGLTMPKWVTFAERVLVVARALPDVWDFLYAPENTPLYDYSGRSASSVSAGHGVFSRPREAMSRSRASACS